MRYTSEDLAALPKIAERLRNNMPHNHIGDPAGLGDPILYCTSCCERREAASALLKAHAEIVRLQGRLTSVTAFADRWDADGVIGTAEWCELRQTASRLEGK